MDDYIMNAFLTALKLSVEDKELPMGVSVFKEKHFNRSIPEGIEINFKNSSFKKIGKFL